MLAPQAGRLFLGYAYLPRGRMQFVGVGEWALVEASCDSLPIRRRPSRPATMLLADENRLNALTAVPRKEAERRMSKRMTAGKTPMRRTPDFRSNNLQASSSSFKRRRSASVVTAVSISAKDERVSIRFRVAGYAHDRVGASGSIPIFVVNARVLAISKHFPPVRRCQGWPPRANSLLM